MSAPPSRLRTDPLSILVPGCGPEERELRERLMAARDVGSAQAIRVDGHARTLNWIVVETAASWVFAPASRAELRDVSEFCLRLLNAASTAERIQGSAN